MDVLKPERVVTAQPARISDQIRAVLPFLTAPITFVSILFATFGSFVVDPTDRLLLAIGGGIGTFLTIVFMIALRPRNWTKGRKLLVRTAAVISAFALGALAMFVYLYSRDAYRPPVALSIETTSYSASPSRDILVSASYDIRGADQGLCGHLWLIDREPIGKDVVVGGVVEKQKIYNIMAGELACRNGLNKVEFHIRSDTASHEFSVWAFNETGNQQWAQLQWDLHHRPTPVYSQDGLFVEIPRDKAVLVSNQVHIMPT